MLVYDPFVAGGDIVGADVARTIEDLVASNSVVVLLNDDPELARAVRASRRLLPEPPVLIDAWSNS